MLKTLAVLIVTALGLSAATAFAATGNPGNVELNLVVAIFTGNIGLFIGLCVAIMGIVQFVKGDAAGAIYIIVLGVLITMLPGIYNGLRMIACPIAESLGGQCGSQE